jgi:hypothetical protein
VQLQYNVGVSETPVAPSLGVLCVGGCAGLPVLKLQNGA